MTYAHVVGGTIQAVGRVPRGARRLDTQEWVLGLRDAGTAIQEACGWYRVAETARPTFNAATHRLERSVQLVAGVPTVEWTVVELTADEKAELTADTNRDHIEDRLRSEIAWLTTAIGSVDGADAAQVKAAVKRLMQQNRAITRFLLGELGSDDGWVVSPPPGSGPDAVTGPDHTTTYPTYSNQGVQYTKGDIVSYHGDLYQCIATHTSKQGEVPPPDAARRWTKV
jgi:hypothetical protein